jgi:hypothetical protein
MARHGLTRRNALTTPVIYDEVAVDSIKSFDSFFVRLGFCCQTGDLRSVG